MDRESSRLSFYTRVTPRLFQSRKPRMQSATTSANNSTPPTFPSPSPQARSTFKATAGSRSRKRPVGDPKGPSVHYEHVATKVTLIPRLPPPSLPINRPRSHTLLVTPSTQSFEPDPYFVVYEIDTDVDYLVYL
ncbi:hypothetical protein K435DRAFT_863605 [Dendrothele bispora CBS 962.96]|uniref:Uncharacterized protein n=1 Tax=Dendrothele bispora (strain CBS 962.96) TaxID=1314807 RepID=A0A4S8LPH9_DENBC|nr:hypothetical protein K435DRAFT_863605 [Dendrothele bispora CBS 962.96]